MDAQGKGDIQRPFDNKKFQENYERIFGKKSPIELPIPKKDTPPKPDGVSSSIFEAFKIAHVGIDAWCDILNGTSPENRILDALEKVSHKNKKTQVSLDQKCDDLSAKFLRRRKIPDDPTC